jgi:hypothetical protein
VRTRPLADLDMVPGVRLVHAQAFLLVGFNKNHTRNNGRHKFGDFYTVFNYTRGGSYRYTVL